MEKEDERRKAMTVNILPSVKVAAGHYALDHGITLGKLVESAIMEYISPKPKAAKKRGTAWAD